MQVKQIPGERRSSFEERRRFVKQAEKLKARGQFSPSPGPGRALRRKHPELFSAEKAGEDSDKM